MAKRSKENPSLSMVALPNYRHDHPFDPVSMLAGEGGGCQDLIGRIHMHVILLGM